MPTNKTVRLPNEKDDIENRNNPSLSSGTKMAAVAAFLGAFSGPTSGPFGTPYEGEPCPASKMKGYTAKGDGKTQGKKKRASSHKTTEKRKRAKRRKKKRK